MRIRLNHKYKYIIAGIKESMYDVEALVNYLLYRLNILDPVCKRFTLCLFFSQH